MVSVSARVRNLSNNHNFADQIQKKHPFAMIEDARKEVLCLSLIKAAFEGCGPCGISLNGLNRARVLTRPDIRDDTVQPYTGPPTRSHPTPAQDLHHHVQVLAIQEGASPALRKALDTMGDKFEETEAALHINKADLKTALEREKPTRGCQKVLSKARVVTAGELATSRHIHTTRRRPRGDADSSGPPKPPTNRGARGRGRGARGGRFGDSRHGAPNAELPSDAENGGDHPAPPENPRRGGAASWGRFGRGRRGRSRGGGSGGRGEGGQGGEEAE